MVPRNIALVTDQPALSSSPSAAGGAFPAIGQGTPNLEDRPVSSAIASVTLESGELVTETMTMNTHFDDFWYPLLSACSLNVSIIIKRSTSAPGSMKMNLSASI